MRGARGGRGGTGSPHLNDQISLFTSFSFRSAMFGQGGDTEVPKVGVKIERDRYGRARDHGHHRSGRLVGRRLRGRIQLAQARCAWPPSARSWH